MLKLFPISSWPGFVPAIYAFSRYQHCLSFSAVKTWMPGTRPGMRICVGVLWMIAMFP
jgi:hypothetical protein